MDAAVPVEAPEEDRVKHARRLCILIVQQDMVELVRIFLCDVAERDPRKSLGKLLVQSHRNPAHQMIRILSASSGSAVATCALTTPY